MSRFNRIYRLSFRKVTGKGYETFFTIETPIEGQEGFEGLQMSAKISMSADRAGITGQTGIINLYNLSSEQKTVINNIKGLHLTLQAGYGEPFNEGEINDLPIIFQGDVLTVKTNRVGDDFITTLKVKTGEVLKKLGRVVRTFPAGSTVSLVSEQIAKSYLTSVAEVGINNFPLEIKVLLPKKVAEKELTSDYVAEGKIEDVLTDFLGGYGCDWTLINESLYIKGAGRDLTKPTNSVEFNPSSIKGRVERITDGVGDAGKDVESITKLKFTSFLEPRLNMNSEVILGADLFKLQEDFSGNYIMVSYDIKLNYRGKEWDSSVEVKKAQEETDE